MRASESCERDTRPLFPRQRGKRERLGTRLDSHDSGVTKTKTLENEDLRPKTRLSFRDYEN